jgi:cytochrome c oxidase subunit II
MTLNDILIQVISGFVGMLIGAAAYEVYCYTYDRSGAIVTSSYEKLEHQRQLAELAEKQSKAKTSVGSNIAQISGKVDASGKISNSAKCIGDKAYDWQLGPQDPASVVMEGIINFHNFLLALIFAIGLAVGIVLYETLSQYSEDKNLHPIKFAHASVLEIVWTAIPALILLYIAGPSFTLLYALDEDCSRSLVYKVTGSQWFWTYSYPDMAEHTPKQTSFSAMFTGYSQKGTHFQGFRLLETDNKLYIPVNTHITFLITSKDVLHSWAVPSFGIKLDACPGRLAHITMFFPRVGLFYGQCSEICGTGHGFMPIVVRVCGQAEWASLVGRKD